MAENLAGDLQTLKSSWEDLGITASDSMDSPLRKVTKEITEIIRNTSKWMQNNPELTATLLKIALIIGVVLAVVGMLALALATIAVPLAVVKVAFGILGIKGGGVVRAIKNIGKAFSFVGKLLLRNPLFIAIALLAIAAYLIYKNWEPIKQFFSDLWDKVTAIFEIVWDKIKAICKGLWDDVKTAFSGGIAGVGALILNWSPIGLFYTAFAAVMRYFGVEMPDKFTEFGGNIISGLIKGLRNKFPLLDSIATGIARILPKAATEKDSINSPSRQFAGYGANHGQGRTIGLQRNKRAPINPASDMAKRLSQLRAGIAIGAATMPAMAFNVHPPLAPRAAGSGMVVHGDTNQITIQAPPGMDENAIARSVANALEQRDRKKAARLRSSLHDY
ncbi:phage tail tape measure protein [Glaciimonas sp. PCH181]|uniref:phage tail tape measure protein n=1 Tax=Glaciimonas sp. PCH181 TaxID=2133943 RepID=UPI000D3A3FA3|nr:phage tail tape measure protein [Glaciimonas sp. PCH181]PUA16836.1 phage tail tape measure protein [Glaciimonas sp. PCH181]